MKSRPLIILAVIIAVVIGAAIWFLQTQPDPTPLPTVNLPEPAKTTTPAPQEASVAVRPESTPPPAATPTPAAPVEEVQLAEWELKIDQILRTETGETETAQMLINLIPTLPPDGQADAAQHVSNLLQDEDYSRVMPLIRNTSLSEEFHDVLLTDLMNREDTVKLPALLEIAKIPNHPNHEEALTDLQIFLDEDYGNNWPQWEAAMKKYLAARAEEAGAVAPAPAAGE